MTDYEKRLHEALIQQQELKEAIAFLRLQIKQERKQERWAKTSPIIKQMKARWPSLRIENGAGCSYLGIALSAKDPGITPHLPEWELLEQYAAYPSKLGSPIVTKYRMKGVPALLYVTQEVY